MEIEVTYSGLQERATKITEKETLGLRMLHDNFDPDWKSGDEPHGTMIFTDVMPESTPLVGNDFAALLAIKEKQRNAKIAKALGI